MKLFLFIFVAKETLQQILALSGVKKKKVFRNFKDESLVNLPVKVSQGPEKQYV